MIVMTLKVSHLINTLHPKLNMLLHTGISPYQYPTPSTTSSNPPYNPSTFHTTHNPASSQIPPQMTPNYLDLPGPSTYHNPIYTNSSPSGSGGVIPENAKAEMPENEDILEDVGARAENGEGGEGEVEEEDNEEPLYVNAKQYHRILKRRAARQRLEELNRLARSRKVSWKRTALSANSLCLQPYLHESRHRHACSRPRGKGGRFLTAEEIEALKKKEEAAKGEAQPQQGV
jgi:nuclear transcription factor Y alpha